MPRSQLGLHRSFGLPRLEFEGYVTAVVPELDPAISEIPFALVVMLRPERRIGIGRVYERDPGGAVSLKPHADSRISGGSVVPHDLSPAGSERRRILRNWELGVAGVAKKDPKQNPCGK